MPKTNRSVGDISDLDFFVGCKMPSPAFWRKEAKKYRNLAKTPDYKGVGVRVHFLIFPLH
jgi:hypothetical protein